MMILQRVNQGANLLGAIIFPQHTYSRERQIKSFRAKVNFFNKLLDSKNPIWTKHISRGKCNLSKQVINRKIISTINSYYRLFVHSKNYSLRKKLFFSMGKISDSTI